MSDVRATAQPVTQTVGRIIFGGGSMNKITEREQQEILDYISWTCGDKPEPDWLNMPSWLVKLHNAQQRAHWTAFKAAIAGVLIGSSVSLIVHHFLFGCQ